jgi:hypothetical protein
MSSIKLESNASGTGIFTIASPNSNTNYTLTLPQATTTVVGTDATQTLTNKTIQGGAITSATAQASTSGTSIDFTGIPSWVKRITVMLNGVSWNNTVTPLIQLGDSGGVETTGYNILVGYTTAGAAANAVVSSSGIGMLGGWDATTLFSGSVIISLLDASTNTWAVGGLVFADWSTDYSINISGTKSLSATLDRVRITSTAAVTFDAGTINILYEG